MIVTLKVTVFMIAALLHKYERKHQNFTYCKISVLLKLKISLTEQHYIFSGASTPIKRNAFANVTRTALINDRRASVNCLFSGFKTFSAL